MKQTDGWDVPDLASVPVRLSGCGGYMIPADLAERLRSIPASAGEPSIVIHVPADVSPDLADKIRSCVEEFRKAFVETAHGTASGSTYLQPTSGYPR